MQRDQSSWTPRQPIQVLKDRTGPCIASQVVETVPSCAISCVESFIQTEYSTSCENTSSLEFLCVTPNPSGFALGEAALRCVVENCSSITSEGLVYSICAGIMNSIPETMATITATVQSSIVESSTASSTTTTTLPPAISEPATTPTLSSFETATGSPAIVVTTTVSARPATFSTSNVPTSIPSTSMSTTQANPAAVSTTASSVAQVHGTLSTPTVAGIAVGSVAVAATVFSMLVFLFCLRKKRRTQRPVSQRWSIDAFPLPPTSKDTEQVSRVPPPAFSPSQRFYALPAPEGRRRSFWRKSINPVDIGVAVAPGKVQLSSPRSISSDKSASGLLANSEGPSRWRSPLNSPLPPKSVPRRPEYAVPDFDERPSNGAFNSYPTCSVHAPYETRLPRPPQQLTKTSYSRPLNSISRIRIQAPFETRLARLPGPPVISQNQAYNAERARGAAVTGRIPLTPIYDNGNFANTSQGRSAPNAYRWETPESMQRLSRPVRQVAAQAPTGLNISNITAQGAPIGRGPLHRSMASDSTTFEDNTTPEEERDRQLKLAQMRSMSEYSNEGLVRIPEGDTSPIRYLAYPQVPRSASLSSQAQQVPRPLAAQNVRTAESASGGVSRGLSRRYEMSRVGQSYLTSETSSSSATAPSLLAQRRIGQQKDLRIKTSNAAASALNSRWQVSTQPMVPPPVAWKDVPVKTLLDRQLKEASPKARVTPKTNSRGDLFLTVED